LIISYKIESTPHKNFKKKKKKHDFYTSKKSISRNGYVMKG
jgi:hypothetical protein